MGLLDEYVFPGLDGRPDVCGVELRRACNEYDVDALDHVTITVETGETMGVIHCDLIRPFLFERFTPILHSAGEDVSHGHQTHPWIDSHGVDGGTGATASTADDPDTNHVAAGGVDAAGQR